MIKIINYINISLLYILLGIIYISPYILSFIAFGCFVIGSARLTLIGFILFIPIFLLISLNDYLFN